MDINEVPSMWDHYFVSSCFAKLKEMEKGNYTTVIFGMMSDYRRVKARVKQVLSN